MGFYSEGVGHGATFFFELPVFSAPPAGSQLMAAQSSSKGKPLLPLLSSSLTCAESGSIDTLSSPVSPSSTLYRTKNRPDSRTSINSLSDIAYTEDGWFQISPDYLLQIDWERVVFSLGRLSKVYCDSSGQEDMLFVRRDFSADERELNSGRNRPLRLQQHQRSPLRFLVVVCEVNLLFPSFLVITLCAAYQDDSSMNRRMIKMLIESETDGIFPDAIVLQADDGVSAVECLRSENAEGRTIDFVLMDFIMVRISSHCVLIIERFCWSVSIVVENAWPRSRFRDAQRAALHWSYHR